MGAAGGHRVSGESRQDGLDPKIWFRSAATPIPSLGSGRQEDRSEYLVRSSVRFPAGSRTINSSCMVTHESAPEAEPG